MEVVNLKIALQRQADMWRETIKELSEGLGRHIDAGGETKDYKCYAALCEYKGKIYAMRAIERFLGIELDTNFF